jgi:ATP-dependent helicase IRC3
MLRHILPLTRGLKIGRGMRLSPGTGKQDCHVIDFVDSVKRVVGVVSAPTLLGLDPTTVVDGTTTFVHLAI